MGVKEINSRYRVKSSLGKLNNSKQGNFKFKSISESTHKFDEKKYRRLYTLGRDNSGKTYDDYLEFVQSEFGGYLDPQTLHFIDIAKNADDFVKMIRPFKENVAIRGLSGSECLPKKPGAKNEVIKRRISKILAESVDPNDIDKMVRGYLYAALFTSDDDNDIPLERSYDVSDIDVDDRRRVEADCKVFLATITSAGLLDDYVRAYNDDMSTAMDQLGHDFWMTRNGHGVGFWDRTELRDDDLGEKLTKIADKFGEQYLYVGDDDVLYIQ